MAIRATHLGRKVSSFPPRTRGGRKKARLQRFRCLSSTQISGTEKDGCRWGQIVCSYRCQRGRLFYAKKDESSLLLSLNLAKRKFDANKHSPRAKLSGDSVPGSNYYQMPRHKSSEKCRKQLIPNALARQKSDFT
jgi:hypothetical protein